MRHERHREQPLFPAAQEDVYLEHSLRHGDFALVKNQNRHGAVSSQENAEGEGLRFLRWPRPTEAEVYEVALDEREIPVVAK